MKILLLVLTVLGFFNVSLAASENRSVRDIYKAQCTEAGGEVNGFCMCSEKLDLLALTSEVIQIAVTTKKIEKSTLGFINPFTQSCTGQEINLKNSYNRLLQMREMSSSYVKNKNLMEELRALEEAGLLEPTAFSQYLANGKFRDQIKTKINTMKTRHSLLVQKGAGKTILTIGTQKLKTQALGTLQQLVDIDIQQAKLLSSAVSSALAQSLEKNSTKTIGATLIGIGKNTLKKGAKAMAKGFIAAVVTSSALEAASYFIGVDLTGFDPFEIAFGVTPAADGTISGAITREVSLIYYPEYSNSMELGFYNDTIEVFSSKVALVSMIAEARSNGDSYVHFLDY